MEAIDELLLVQLGREKGYRLSDEQFNDWLTNLRKQQNLKDDQKFQAALKQEGMTIEELRRNVERQMLISRVQQDEVGSKLQITEEEARQYYLSHQEEFRRAGDRHAARDPDRGAGHDATGAGRRLCRRRTIEAAADAKAIRARLGAGEDFAKVAGEVSAAPSKANGGLIGPIDVGELSPVAAADARKDEARRDHPADPHGARVSDSEARSREAAVRRAVRERARCRRRQSVTTRDSGPKLRSSSSGSAARRSSSGRTPS